VKKLFIFIGKYPLTACKKLLLLFLNSDNIIIWLNSLAQLFFWLPVLWGRLS